MDRFGNLKRALLPFMGESMYTFMKDVHSEIRKRNADRRRGGGGDGSSGGGSGSAEVTEKEKQSKKRKAAVE